MGWTWRLVLIVLSAMSSIHGAACAGAQDREAPAPAPPPAPRRIVGYFAHWNERSPAELPGELLTHVNYAFARITDGEISLGDAAATAAAIERAFPGDDEGAVSAVPFRGHFRQLQLLKQKHPRLRTLVSVGGWGGSRGFSDIALTDTSRAKFAQSCARFASTYGFDGIDIDWEFPVSGGADGTTARPEDGRNFTLLLEALRRALDEQGKADRKQYLLTFAAPAGAHNYGHLELDRVHRHVDWINLMTYDYAGAWSKVASFNAPLYAPAGAPSKACADATVRAYLAAGVPADKIVLGVPFYGRAFGGVASVNNGLYQPHDRKPPAPTGGGHWIYSVIADRYVNKSARRFWHDEAKVPWLYDETSALMVSYDDPESLRHKAAYARDHNLGGIMIWELCQDDEQSSLLKAVQFQSESR